MKPVAVPQGIYVAAKRHGNLVYTSGMTPRSGGVLMYRGIVKANESVESCKNAVELATNNALTAASSLLQAGEKIGGVLSLNVYIAAEHGFTAHSVLADYASNYLQREIGEDGVGTRTTIGVLNLPGNAPVEIQLTAIVSSTPN